VADTINVSALLSKAFQCTLKFIKKACGPPKNNDDYFMIEPGMPPLLTRKANAKAK
jgi:hypothetical protein